MCAEWQDWNVWRNRADLDGGQVAVHAGHGYIQNHQAQLRGVLACQRDTRNPITCPNALIAWKRSLSQAHQRVPQHGVIIDDQDNIWWNHDILANLVCVSAQGIGTRV